MLKTGAERVIDKRDKSIYVIKLILTRLRHTRVRCAQVLRNLVITLGAKTDFKRLNNLYKV